MAFPARMAGALAAALLSVAAAVGVVPQASAADDFNVGDRVEVDDLGNSMWRAGVVIAEDGRTYLVRMDPQDVGGSTVEYTVPKTGIYETRIRGSSASLPSAQKKNSSQPTGILDCPIEAGIPNQRLDDTVLAKLIRCLNEYKDGAGSSALGTDSRFDITKMTIGKPRAWNVLNDIGPGTAATQVYPVKVSYTQTWWSKESVRTQKGISIYGCYYSTLSEWTCASNSSIKREPMLVQPREGP